MHTWRLATLVTVFFLAMAAHSGEGQPKGLCVWDTGKPAAEALAPAVIAAKDGWTALSPDQTAVSFKGDAVMTNGRLWVVWRQQSPAIECYAVATGGVVSRARLLLVSPSGESAAKLERLALTENTKSTICLEAVCKTEKGADMAAKLRLKRGDMIALETEPGAGAGRLRIECPSEYVVLPDFFADDIVLNPRKIPLAQTDVPSENFVLHLTGNRNCIAMVVFENREQEARIALSGEGEKRVITGSEIAFGEAGKQAGGKQVSRNIWVALLERPGIWHKTEVLGTDAGKTMQLEWKMPMVAQWRVDFSRPDDLTDSWEMLLQEKAGGDYTKPGWLKGGTNTLKADRKRWTTVLGSFLYPCWSDPELQGFLQPLKHKELLLQGPVVIYPINRMEKTPLDPCTVVDIVRSTLGVGPCEYILDVEGNKGEYQGRATCSTRDKLIPIYKAGEQKKKREEISKTLDEALTFVKHIRGRITRYVEFGHKILEYLAEQKKAHPELSEPIADLEKVTRQLDARFEARRAEIKTPDDVAAMNDAFRKNILDDDGPDAVKKCTEFAKALVVIGGSQDELAGECRWVVKSLRQRAGLLMTLNPKLAPIAAEIRARTQETLKNPANHEGARH